MNGIKEYKKLKPFLDLHSLITIKSNIEEAMIIESILHRTAKDRLIPINMSLNFVARSSKKSLMPINRKKV